MKNKKKQIIITLIGIISLIVITVGVTYAFFNYAKEGTTDNVVKTGTITFLYTEVSGVGKGISLTEAYPVADSIGKVQTGEGKVFDFKVTSNISMNSSIGYQVTARKKSDSTLDESAVRMYLTKVTGIDEEEVLLDNYSNLTQTTKVETSKYTEKTIYQGKVPANSTNYEQAFRLRMWIDENTDFSPNEDGTYPYNGKTFTVTVNVYANAKIVTDSDIALESNADISSLSIGDEVLTKVEGQDYNYETTLLAGTTSTTINVETESPYATVSIERIDSLAYQESNIKRLSTKRALELNPGDNYFKVTVTSENKEVINEFKIKISVEKPKIVLKDEILRLNPLITESPTLTTSSNNTSDASGLYKSTATNDGSPTYYFRGNVENNYVSFAGFTWRIVRINEDGTIRLIMSEGIYGSKIYGNSNQYYTLSSLSNNLNYWYEEKIKNNYSNKLATGDYYCEQAKVKSSNNYSFGNAVVELYTDYVPNFKCEEDGNGHGIVKSNIGLLTYDEIVYAGGYYNKNNNQIYLNNGNITWTMSPNGYRYYGSVWELRSGMIYSQDSANASWTIRPVINLKADITAIGSGTSTDPFVVQ